MSARQQKQFYFSWLESQIRTFHTIQDSADHKCHGWSETTTFAEKRKQTQKQESTSPSRKQGKKTEAEFNTDHRPTGRIVVENPK
jgi:hypothetical protein